MLVYKILAADEWREAKQSGQYLGSAVDRADGFVHLSSAQQVVQTAARHYAGRRGLMLLTIDADRLGDDLRWEPSRGGELFPHLYASLPTDTVVGEAMLPDDVPADAAVARLLERADPPGTAPGAP